ncbi:hypothetical protein A5668_00730 [Mycolicibacterium fortuitum]|uniref:Uncharacterized protein n=1 Tax=Mycolicibacterium fortuitum TaxID=1766 RepID=A0ABD6QEZ8_MYCFO|nr:hypothetical protein A5668_00730 [Mycolicibacterium fortuitum]OMC37388.1 hypothetical protein A5742_09250 [Mycolicibacterium fortuitum]
MRFPQVVIEHHRAVFGLLRSIRKSRQSGFAHARSRPGLAARSAPQARIALRAPRIASSTANSHSTPLSVARARKAAALKYGVNASADAVPRTTA